MNLYAESSAVLAWLLGESKGADVREQLSGAQRVFTSDLTLIECDRVLNRVAALQELGDAQVTEDRRLLGTAAEHWTTFAIDTEVVERSRRPFPHEPIRTLDAIHLSTALLVRNLVPDMKLLSLDERIRSNAAELGLDILPDR